MDPQILTLSLGSWMALPGLKFNFRDSSEKRAYASNVAKYYEEYAEKMGLSRNLKNNVMVSRYILLLDQKQDVFVVCNKLSKKMLTFKMTVIISLNKPWKCKRLYICKINFNIFR